jgi:hypothetical protein
MRRFKNATAFGRISSGRTTMRSAPNFDRYCRKGHFFSPRSGPHLAPENLYVDGST